jgi:outer membrane protein TolC
MMLAASGLYAQRLTLAEAIDGALEQSVDLTQTDLRIASSRLRESAVLESTAPSLEFSSEPAYSLVTQRVPETTVGPTTTPGSDLLINSTRVGLGVVQPLPTAGVVSGSLGLGFSATTTRPDDGDASTSYALDPSFSLAISQPLFTGDDFIEAEQPGLILEQARRGTSELEVSREIIRRQVAAVVINLYTQIGTLRRSVELQGAQRELLETQLDQAEIRRESGIGSREDELELQVQINRIDDALLQSQLGIRELSIEFERLTGIAIGPDVELEPAELLGTRVSGRTSDVIPSPTEEQRAAALATERAETDLVLAAKQSRATASAALSLTPRYMDQRESPDELAGAVTDYFGDGAGVDVVFSLGITVPIGEESGRAREREQARISLDLARSEEERLERETRYQRELFQVRIRSLESRIELAQFELEFRRDQLANELELVELGVSSQATADTIRNEILAQELALEDLAAQLFLARMDLAAALGGDIAGLVRP